MNSDLLQFLIGIHFKRHIVPELNGIHTKSGRSIDEGSCGVIMCCGLVNGLEPQAKQYAKELIPILCVTAIGTLLNDSFVKSRDACFFTYTIVYPSFLRASIALPKFSDLTSI